MVLAHAGVAPRRRLKENTQLSSRVFHCRENSHSRRTVLAAATTGFVEFISRNGGDAEKIFSRVGLAENQLSDINLPLNLGSYVRMMELAAADTGNDNFGLWFGQQFKPEMLGLIGGIAVASPTLGAALGNLARLFPYHQQATHTAFTRQGELLSLEYRIIDGGIVERRHDAELTLGMFVNVLRHCLGTAWTPERIHFEHPKPREWRQHEQAFSAPVHFGQRTNALIIRNDRLHQRMPQGDLHRANLLCDQLVRISGGIGVLSLLDHVKGEIRSRLPDGMPPIEAIAESIGLQRWTLQRRLTDYGLSFLDVVDLVRRELAERHIRERYVTILEISEILGYSELSAFSRAFRRWFGTSPQKFRAKLFVADPSWE
jgi:AraC-like DNA-binding protein